MAVKEKTRAQVKGLAVKRNDGIELDYSVNSIDFVDKFLQKFSDEGMSVNDFAETIFVAGSYVGQVMINNNNGQWIEQDKASLPSYCPFMPKSILRKW